MKVASLFFLKKYKAGEKAIEVDDKNVQWHIILTGSFRVGDKDIIRAGNVFNDSNAINKEKLVEVVALEPSSVIVISPNDLFHLINQESMQKNNKNLISFLSESIPKFSEISGSLKYRLARFFVEKTFNAGNEILTEGAPSDCAYLIKEGKCKIFSKENPLNDAQEEEEVKVRSLTRKFQRTTKKLRGGYLSLSIYRYQIMTIEEKEWFGDEILIDSAVSPYSVATVVKTTLLIINKENLDKFPGDVLTEMRQNIREKLQWRNERTKELVKSIVKISKLSSLPSERHKLNSKGNKPSYTLNASCFNTRYNSGTYRNTLESLSTPIHRQRSLKRHLNSDKKIQSDSFGIQDKRVLELAAMFKTLNKRGSLRPAMIYRPYIPKTNNSILRLNVKEKIKKSKVSEIMNKKIIVGVKEVRVVDLHSHRPLPSPNLLRIHNNSIPLQY